MDPLKQTVSDVLKVTGRKSPELGGGAASILSGLIGMSLIRMAAATTAIKNDLDAAEALAPIDHISARLEDLARADVEVFRRYVAALRLPHETEGEETARDEVLDETGAEAAQTPLQAALLMVEGLEIAARIAPQIDAEVASDVYAGAAIVKGAFLGAIATLDINLRPQRMASRRTEMLAQRSDVLGRQKAAMVQIGQQAELAGHLLD
jgi:formiminotetrahydrofolate cyclodeaminase